MIAALSMAAAHAAPPSHPEIVFESYSPLATNRELLARTVTPLIAKRLGAELAKSPAALDAQSIDLAQERFKVYVPEGPAPAGGYGLLVFVAPWDQTGIPALWVSVLDHRGVIAVTAGRSGNEENVIGRRIPLALAGYENVKRRYPLNPERVYVGGFSGGSRVALRMALAFPDVFRGALLNSGSDPIGTLDVPLPSAALFTMFETRTRLVYVTGTEDEGAAASDRRSVHSVHDICVSDPAVMPMRNGGHEPADAQTLARAITELDAPTKADPDLERCRARRHEDLARQLANAGKLIDAGKLEDAGKALIEIDAHYGGLAAPESIDLVDKLRPRGVNLH